MKVLAMTTLTPYSALPRYVSVLEDEPMRWIFESDSLPDALERARAGVAWRSECNGAGCAVIYDRSSRSLITAFQNVPGGAKECSTKSFDLAFVEDVVEGRR